MDLAICSFASSSSGNSYVIKSEDTSVIVDTGITAKAIDAGMAYADTDYDSLGAILITHEHGDHIKSLHTLVKRRPLKGPIFATGGTQEGILEKVASLSSGDFETVKRGDTFRIKDIRVNVFEISHDTPEPVCYSFEKNGKKIAIVTDTGYITEEIFQAVSGADVLVLEANHEKNLLLYGRYPYPLKRRILSDTGHLSNEDCGGALCRYLTDLGGEKIPQVILAHLSSENNTPMQAFLTVRNILEENDFYVGRDLALLVAPKDTPSQLIVI